MPGQPGWRRRRWEWSEAVISSQNYVQPKPAVRNSLEGEVIVLSPFQNGKWVEFRNCEVSLMMWALTESAEGNIHGSLDSLTLHQCHHIG